MKTTQVIQLTKLPTSAKLISKSHKFLNENLLPEVCFYVDHGQQLEYISFFGCIYFALVEVSQKDELKSAKVVPALKLHPLFSLTFYYADKDADDESISKLLRGSRTLTVCEKNTFNSTSVKAVFAEKSAWIWPKKNGKSTFERYLLLYLLARSYNLFAEKALKEVVRSYDLNHLSKMIEHREAILAFDLRCFYSNPVLVTRHELRKAWPLLSRLFELNQVHDEMKTQVQDLSGLITTKQNAQQDSRYKRIELLFWVLGGIVALVTLMDSETVNQAVSGLLEYCYKVAVE